MANIERRIMKAIEIDEFGGPEKMFLRDIPRPVPGDDDVLVKIAYAGVNPVDWKIREGQLAQVFPHDFPITLGWDASGFIEEVGKNVPRTRVGQFVFGYCRQYGKPVKAGTYAEYIAVPATMAVPAPANITPAQAAAIPLAALTAWQGLLEAGHLKAGETVLIPGGAGGVGSMALQIAKYTGARVLTVASKANQAFVTSMGADEAISYDSENVEAAIKRLAPGGVDLLFDCYGEPYINEGMKCVRPGGRLVTVTGFPDENLARERGIDAKRIVTSSNAEHMAEISKLLKAGKLVVPPVAEFPLSEVAAAHAKNKAGHVRGKIVLKIA
jgi:NADPH:quinone reductase-like Zn-dependent oxidoreductase